jgi:RNA polymerase sigma factor (sigma-70 family)
MPTAQLEPIARFIRQAVHDTAAGTPDAHLLACFAAQGDEDAFSALVHRHGPLVLGVCRRTLRDVHAADDAFQATFLLLARKAGSLSRPERLSSWLHGVACRVAARARAEGARRRARERLVVPQQAVGPDDDLVWRDLRPVLYEEINRLPARQRDAVVLCYLEGQTNAEAATRLGCPRGSVATLLARARLRLRQRLTRRGLALPAVLAGVWLTRQAQAASLPSELACSTVQTARLCAAGGLQASGLASVPAAVLAKGVARDMLMKKLKVSVAFLLVAVALAGAGSGFTAYRVAAEQPMPAKTNPPPRRAHLGQEPAEAAPRPAEPAAEVVTYRTANFEVTAPTREAARKVARAAERHRKALALLWLGEEMPAWKERCPVRVRLSDKGISSYSTFRFDQGKVIGQSMQLEGGLDKILADLLPHEVTHTILAHWSGKPLPRWADEGAALLAESKESRARHAQAVLTILDEKRALPLRRLLPLAEFPQDVMALYAQGYSLTDFLVRKGGRARFLVFIKRAGRDGWVKATKGEYGYASLENLERVWLAHARKTPREAEKPGKVVAGASGWSGPRRKKKGPTGRLPDAPPPIQALVVLKGDRLTVWRKEISYLAVTRAVPGRPETVTSYERSAVMLDTTYALKQVKAHDARGKPVEHKKLRELLKEEMPALVSADGQPVDPLHLRLVKEDTLVFVLPAPVAPPPPAVPLTPAATGRPAK